MKKALKLIAISIGIFLALTFIIGGTASNKPDPKISNAESPKTQLPARKEPTYIIDGAYPGMTADQAKAIGYTNCRNVRAEKDSVPDVLCSKPSSPASLFGLPVENISIRFVKPFEISDSVIVTFKDVHSNRKECRPTKGQWGDVISGDCKSDMVPSIAKIIGQPVGTSYGKRSGAATFWHKCGSDTLSFYEEFYSANAKTPNMIIVRTGLDKINAEQCAAASAKKAEENKLEAEKQKKLAESKSFIDKMK